MLMRKAIGLGIHHQVDNSMKQAKHISSDQSNYCLVISNGIRKHIC